MTHEDFLISIIGVMLLLDCPDAVRFNLMALRSEYAISALNLRGNRQLELLLRGHARIVEPEVAQSQPVC